MRRKKPSPSAPQVGRSAREGPAADSAGPVFRKVRRNPRLRCFAFRSGRRAAFGSGSGRSFRCGFGLLTRRRIVRWGRCNRLLFGTAEHRNTNRGCDYQADQLLHYVLQLVSNTELRIFFISAPTERLRQRWCAGKADPPLLFGKDRMRSIYRVPYPSRSGQGPKRAPKLLRFRPPRRTTGSTATSYPGYAEAGQRSGK